MQIGKIAMALLALCVRAGAQAPKDPQAVQEVMAGKRTVANAAWWGFDAEDATDALQAALSSGAKKVIVPHMGRDWIVRPLRLAGNQEIVLEKGVVITAKRGEYRGGGDSVFTASDADNLTIRGYGATIRMQKEDYIVGHILKNLGWNRWFGQYAKAEWRMTLALRGCNNVKVLGVTLRDSGGDGIYVDGSGRQRFCHNVTLKDVVCDNNYRQGISIISVDGLRAENCAFNNTWGTPPSSGVDIEPDSPEQRVQNVVFRSCRFEDNYGDGIEVFLAHLKRESGDVSILFDRCRVASRRGAGIRVVRVNDDGPGGLVEFRDCVVDGVEGYGLKVKDKSMRGARVRFVRCRIRDAARNRSFADTWVPILLNLAASDRARRIGGIELVDCVVLDDRARPAISIENPATDAQNADITGSVRVHNTAGAAPSPIPSSTGVTLRVVAGNGDSR